MKKLLSAATSACNFITQIMDKGSHLFALGVRYYLAHIFFWSGYLKITSWQSTLYIFSYEYKITYMPPHLAAYLGTAAELILPVFLLLGLGARLPAIVLFIVNVFTVISYPILLTPEGACMIKDSYLWGVLAAILIFYGPGKISLDYLLQKKVCPNYQY